LPVIPRALVWRPTRPKRQFLPVTFKLKVEGTQLAGAMAGDQFEQPIQNNKITGDDISFTVHLEFRSKVHPKGVARSD